MADSQEIGGPMTKQDIAQLREQAEAEFRKAEAEFKQKIDALAIVEQMLPASAVSPKESALNMALERIEQQFGPSAVRPRVPLLHKENQGTVIDAVRKTILSSPKQTWPVSEIEQDMRRRNFVFTARDPKSTINTALTRLVDQGEVRIVVRGKGRKPSRYKASDQVEARSENPDEAQEKSDAAA
jgi:hypothetical protein